MWLRVHVSRVSQGWWKSVTLTDCHLVMGDFMHHDISASIPKAAPFKMSPTQDVLRFLLVTYLAALRWTISILLMSDLRWGSHTEQTYSSDGLTNDLYACSFSGVEPMFRLWRKKSRVLLALPQIWGPH